MAAKTPYAVIMDTLQPMLEPEHADAMAGQITAALGAAGFVICDACETTVPASDQPPLLRTLGAAAQALRSYQYGNASPDLAREVADAVEARIGRLDAPAEGR